jgi:hypothetical protein
MRAEWTASGACSPEMSLAVPRLRSPCRGQLFPHPLVVSTSPYAKVIISPHKNAVQSPTAATSPTQCDQPIAAIERDWVFYWRRTSGYNALSRTKNTFSHYKRTIGGGMRR